MKNLIQIIQEKLYHQQVDEKLIFNKYTKSKYNYHPKTLDELKELVDKLIGERGNNADLNDIDTSKITDMSKLFEYDRFNGNISKWDVSNVKDMSRMFKDSLFTGEYGDISDWDIRNVENMDYMFVHSYFNGDISNWDVRNVTNMGDMFYGSSLEKNPPKWYKK